MTEMRYYQSMEAMVEVLRAAGRPMSPSQMAKAAGLSKDESGPARMALGVAITRGNTYGGALVHVRQVGHGLYTYDESLPESKPVWEELAKDGETYVLRGPDGIYVAKKLSAALKT
jgi:hypothetical protein